MDALLLQQAACGRTVCGCGVACVRAALGKLRLRARKRALAFDVSPTPQKHSGKKFRDGFLLKVWVFLEGHQNLTKPTTIKGLSINYVVSKSAIFDLLLAVFLLS